MIKESLNEFFLLVFAVISPFNAAGINRPKSDMTLNESRLEH
jgi:hypothetical protein